MCDLANRVVVFAHCLLEILVSVFQGLKSPTWLVEEFPQSNKRIPAALANAGGKIHPGLSQNPCKAYDLLSPRIPRHLVCLTATSPGCSLGAQISRQVEQADGNDQELFGLDGG